MRPFRERQLECYTCVRIGVLNLPDSFKDSESKNEFAKELHDKPEDKLCVCVCVRVCVSL